MTWDLTAVLASLGVEDAVEALEPHWQESCASLPAQPPPFLDPAALAELCEYTYLPPEVEMRAQALAATVRQTPSLYQLAWHCYRLAFTHLDYEAHRMRQWPALPGPLGETHDLLYLLIGLGMVPLTRAYHQSRGIPDVITRHTCDHFNERIATYALGKDGRLGYPVEVLYWLRNYVVGELYTLGRMEYMVKPFHGHVRVYRNTSTGDVLALSGDGMRFNAEGYLDAPADDTDAGGWTSRVVVEDDSVTGCPVSPAGVGLRTEVTLPLSEWRCVLKAGDPVLDTHIPSGGGMSPDACRDTMQQALDFFPRYFPERPFVGFACASWILNPQLADIYSPTSNMVLWQRELYLYPWPSGPRSGIYFMFGRDNLDLATARRDSSLRRAVLDHLTSGGALRTSGMFLLTDDWPDYGSQHYLSQWPPSVLRV